MSSAIKSGLKFTVNGEPWKVYTKVGDGLWSCMPLTPGRTFTEFTEEQIREALRK